MILNHHRSARIRSKTFLALSFLCSLFIASPVACTPVEAHALAATDLPLVKSDVMDDPAIWINQKDPSKSLILATNKRPPYGGLYVYTLEGKLKSVSPIGPLNNVDYRPDFPYKGTTIDIAVASYPLTKKFAFFAITPLKGDVTFLGFSSTAFHKEPYGLCLLKRDNTFYAIVTFVGGGAEKWQFWEKGGTLHTQKITSYPIKTQAEGCVANDQEETLFIAEEGKGIWAFMGTASPHLIAKVGENNLKADLEGLALYNGKYLIASSQGNSTYGVFSAHLPYTYLGSFKIAPTHAQEGTEETDGIDVTAHNLGGSYSQGLFVAHDNRFSKGGGSNFKLVPWTEIAQKLGLK